ncbi:hypothetical protein SpCBS45565_g01505 [Spizellomyces sp. 'palustris']|nr:hypothetical protein SpCBS45565_g01505 [Spizellomyces sp. 'palustris']
MSARKPKSLKSLPAGSSERIGPPLLPPEVLDIVFQNLNSPQSLLACALTCSAFETSAIRQLWKVIAPKSWDEVSLMSSILEKSMRSSGIPQKPRTTADTRGQQAASTQATTCRRSSLRLARRVKRQTKDASVIGIESIDTEADRAAVILAAILSETPAHYMHWPPSLTIPKKVRALLHVIQTSEVETVFSDELLELLAPFRSSAWLSNNGQTYDIVSPARKNSGASHAEEMVGMESCWPLGRKWLTRWPYYRFVHALDFDSLTVLGQPCTNPVHSGFYFDLTLSSLFSSCIELQSIKMFDFPLGPKAVQCLLSSCRKLKYVHLPLCRLTDDTLRKLLTDLMPQLERLDVEQPIWDDSEITDDTMALLINRCNRMNSLGLAGCRRVKEDTLLKIIESMDALRSFDAGALIVSDQLLDAIANKHGRTLVNLCLRKTKHVTSHGLQLIAESCPALRQLDLTDTCVYTDDAIKVFARSCPLLTHLHLGADDALSSRITDESLRAISSLPHLVIVQLLGQDSISDTGIYELATHGRGLEEFTVSCGDSVTERSLIPLIRKSGKRLRNIFLFEGSYVTSRVLKVLEESCPELETLWIFACPQISKRSLKMWLQRNANAKNLQKFSRIGCDYQFTERERRQLQDLYYNLKFDN